MSGSKRVVVREDRIKAYETAVRILSDNGCILRGAGGALIIVHPRTQESEGLTQQCLAMAEITESVAEAAGARKVGMMFDHLTARRAEFVYESARLASIAAGATRPTTTPGATL